MFDEPQIKGKDREFRTALAQASGDMSPLDLGLATMDWILHLAISPKKRMQLIQNFLSKVQHLSTSTVESLFKRNAVILRLSVVGIIDTVRMISFSNQWN